MRKEILISLILILWGCSNPELKNEGFETLEENQQRVSREFLRKSLPGPDSVMFRNQIGSCGEVNYVKKRNTYTGFKRFIMVDQNIVLMEGFTDPENFEFAWKTTCKQRWS